MNQVPDKNSFDNKRIAELEQAHEELKRQSAQLADANARSAILMAEIEEKNAALEESQLKLEEMNQKLRQEEIELRKAFEKLHQTHENLQATQNQLVQSEKMASVGVLAAGVAHEINNPMGYIFNNLTILKGYFLEYSEYWRQFNEFVGAFSANDDQASRQILGRMKKQMQEENFDFILADTEKLINQSIAGAERITTIVKNLKTFSSKDEGVLEKVPIKDIIESVINMVGNELKYNVTLTTNYGDNPPVVCYPQKLSQVFINLLINAAQAIEGKGKIDIQAYSRGDRVVVEVADNGCGIPQGNCQQIFTPFFTTKPVGVGTGLGLSISHDIIKHHHGEILIESEVGKGTKFIVSLPYGPWDE